MLKNLRTLFSLGIVYSLGTILQHALNFVLIPLYTYYLNSEDYGVLGLMSITVGLVNIFISTPIISGFNRFYYLPENKTNKEIFVFNSIILVLIKSLIVTVIIFFIRQDIAAILLGNKKFITIVNVYCFIILFQPLQNLFMSFLILLQRAKSYILVNLISTIISSSIIIYLLIFKKMDIMALIYGNLFNIIFSSLLISPILRKLIKIKFSFKIIKESLKYGYGNILSGFSIFFLQSGDTYLIRIFSSIGRVGLYSFGYSISLIINIILSIPLKYALHPLILKMEGQEEEIRKFLKTFCTIFYSFAVYIFLILSIFCKDLVMLLSSKEEFYSSWVVIPILAFCMVQYALGSIVSMGTIMAKKAVIQSLLTLYAAISNVIFNIILIPFFDIIGAAFSTFISYLIWNGLKIYYSSKYYKLKFEISRILKISLIGISLFLLSLLTIKIETLFLSIMIKILLITIYPFIFIFFKFFTFEEVIYIKQLIDDIKTAIITSTKRVTNRV